MQVCRFIIVPFGYSNISFPIVEDTKNVLSVIYYDGYCDIFSEEGNAESFLFAANPLVEEEEQAATVRGLTTVSKTRVLEENGEWLASVIYYDDYHRSIQTQTQQMGGKWDIMTNLYDFSGKVLNTYQEHQSQIEPVVVQQSFEYDHVGRLLKTYHKVNQQETILLSNVHYNEVGQVKRKGLHQEVPLQAIAFKYNIRGWLTHINELDNISQNEESKLFAFRILYDEAEQFNGNIGKVEWRTTTDAVQRSYKFDYDKLNRLKEASYFNDGTSNYEENYSVFDIIYDKRKYAYLSWILCSTRT